MVLQMVGIGRSQRTSSKSFAPTQSLPQEDFRSWTDPPPMAATLQGSPMRVPYPHFAMVAIDASGRTQFHSSHSLARDCQMLFVHDVRERLAKYTAGTRVGPREFTLNRHTQPQDDLLSPHSRKRRRAPSSYCSFQPAEYDQVEDDFAGEASRTVSIEIGDDKKLNQYYEDAFHTLQQIICRHIAKAYIKAIEPRKQVKHPYNGGRPSAPGEKPDPEKTKPSWWPANVRHREPDHLRKKERVELLIHIFRKLHKTHGVSADKLQEAALDTHRKIELPLRRQILDDLYRVKRDEESYFRNEIDGSTVIHVMNLESSRKQAEREESALESPMQDRDTPVGIVHTTSPTPIKSEQITTPEAAYPERPAVQFSQTQDLSGFAIDTKTSSQPGYGYLPQSAFAPAPVIEDGQQHHQMLGQWTPYQQQSVFDHLGYETSATVPMMAHSLVQQQSSIVTTEPTTTSMQSPPIGLPLTDISGIRQTQSFDFTAPHMEGLTYRTGSLSQSHPHLLHVNSEAITHGYK